MNPEQLFNRRRFLLGTTAIIATPILASCTSTSGGGSTPSVTLISGTALAFLQSGLGEFQQIEALVKTGGGNIPATVDTGISDAISVLGALNSASTETQGETALNQVIGDINGIAPVVVPIITAINPAIGTGLGLFVAALPAGMALFNLAVASFQQLTPTAQQLAKAAPAPATSLPYRGAATAPPSSTDYLNELLRRHGHAPIPVALQYHIDNQLRLAEASRQRA